MSLNCRIITTASAARKVPPTAITMSETEFLYSVKEEMAAENPVVLAVCALFVFGEPSSSDARST